MRDLEEHPKKPADGINKNYLPDSEETIYQTSKGAYPTKTKECGCSEDCPNNCGNGGCKGH